MVTRNISNTDHKFTYDTFKSFVFDHFFLYDTRQ